MAQHRAAADRHGPGNPLDDVTFDLLPGDGFEEALSHVPDGSRVAVVLTPDIGVEPTVQGTEYATERGYEVVPHIAARFVEDRAELDRIAGRLTDAGVEDLFVPGGDRDEPVGEFSSAYDLLVALEELGYEFEEVGIGGYPTGHVEIDDATLAEAMERKAPHATYLVTQLCFDAGTIREWIDGIRGRGIDLPVEVGIPGVVNLRRLMAMSREWGVAQPLQFVRKTTGVLGFAKALVASRGRYTPDDMVDGLAPCVGDDHYGVRRLRLYTFNQTADTETWRRERLG
jgi:methylenetetrahydrofolate reductase (NADPH)